MTHYMPTLPYEMEALAPHMSKETLEFHYGKHLQTYVDNLNRLITGTPYENESLEYLVCHTDGAIFNNAAQAWNHAFFFESLTPQATLMPEELKQALTASFGSHEKFKELFTQAATTLFGSGWIWLCAAADGKLQIISKSNAGNPLTDGLRPLLVIDVWEHAYYIDYRNRRPAFIEAFWKLVNWEKVAARLSE